MFQLIKTFFFFDKALLKNNNIFCSPKNKYHFLNCSSKIILL